MPSAPWKCSQCGTVNEPAATSCRGCGRWPSLFDLQESAIGDESAAEEAPVREVPRYEPQEFEAEGVDEIGEISPASAPDQPPTTPEQRETRSSGRGRTRSPAQRLVRLVIPIGFLLYFLISSYLRSH